MNCDIDKKRLILEKAKDMIITESYSSLSNYVCPPRIFLVVFNYMPMFSGSFIIILW